MPLYTSRKNCLTNRVNMRSYISILSTQKKHKISEHNYEQTPCYLYNWDSKGYLYNWDSKEQLSWHVCE